jgi:hypothetical protein
MYYYYYQYIIIIIIPLVFVTRGEATLVPQNPSFYYKQNKNMIMLSLLLL